MRALQHAIVLLLAPTCLFLVGCKGPQSKMASTEPALDQGTGTTIVQAEPAKTQVTAVDRHPLLAAPRDFYNNTNSNPVVKTAAATFVGVPVGLFGEAKQIFVGVPPELRNQ